MTLPPASAYTSTIRRQVSMLTRVTIHTVHTCCLYSFVGSLLTVPTSPRPGPPARRRQGRRAALRDDGGPDLREAILTATMDLLAEHDFGDLAVSDVLAAAG